MKVVEELITWAKTLPAWQADAVRRIWVNRVISDTDVAAVYELLKNTYGLGTGETKPIPFSKDHLASGTVHQKLTVLKGLLPTKNVNAIVSDTPLRFSPRGVTIVYGDNAAGKSGFSRILKRACRARGATSPIHPNVFASTVSHEPAQAEIYVEIDGKSEETLQWSDVETPPECLANIAVFDAQTARLYVDEANEVRYIPYGLDVFEKLASLCRTLQVKINSEISALPKDPDILKDLVGLGKPISVISAETTEHFIDEQTPFTDSDAKRLEELRKELAKLIAQDPTKEAARWKRLISRIQQLRTTLNQVRQLCSDESVQTLKAKQKGLQDSKQAASLAAQQAFGKEPLQGTGGEAWCILFDAARKFSEVDAYPQKPFPATDDDSRCVLCQQLLGGEAKDRLKRFWEFIQKDVATTVRTNEHAFAEAVKEFSAISGYLARIDQSLMEELDEYNRGLGETIRALDTSYRQRYEAIDSALKNGDWNAVTALLPDASSDLIQLETSCTDHMQRCEASTNASERERVEKEIKDYVFRELAFNSRSILKGHLRSVQVRARLNSCLKATDTTSITRKGNQLMEDALTGELRKALQTECANLGTSGIPLQLKKSGSYGSTLHQVGLRNAQVTPSGVLSEGEQRIVAIASFFAELGTSDHNCGIVFDDPVCSLDHRYRRNVAARMAQEGAKRQVIVFTHDLLFLSRLIEACECDKVEHMIESVRRVGNRCGVCDDSIPWDGMSTSKRIGALKNTHQALKALYDTGDHAKYDRLARNCYDHLRKGWERAVEEVLLGNCIQRFAPEVQTKKLRNVIVTNEDYEAVDKGMTKCSAWITGHDHAAADNSPVPEPAELLADILELETFVESIRKRHAKRPAGIAQQKSDTTHPTKASVMKKPDQPD